MQIGCSRCEARYDIPDDKLGRGGVKVRCSRCGHLFVVRKRAQPTESAEPPRTEEASSGRFDFAPFQGSSEVGPSLGPEEGAPSDSFSSLDGAGIPPVGELDLGDFGGIGDEFDFDLGEQANTAGPAREEEPLPQVRAEELVSARAREPQLQDLAEDMPRLNIQRGLHRGEGDVSSPLGARDRRRSPLFWVVVAAALCTAGFTGYNLWRHPDEALSFLSASNIRKLWQRHAIEAEFGKEELKGYYKDLPTGRRMFVIQGLVVNRSPAARSFIRVEGQLYGKDGKAVASKTVYCGNVLSDKDLAGLPVQTIESRLQNQMGEAFNNVDIAPGARVQFMVVFPSPPPGVEKFSVTVAEAKMGSKS
jgi:predicted Zn finger-like uncharacterized protein